MLLVLPFVPRASNVLPKLFWQWGNNISINGDSAGWQKPDGSWVCIRDQAPPHGVAPVSYDDPAYTGDAYYAPGHHPRSFLARYVWLGWRNRAVAALLDAAVSPGPVEVVEGDPAASRQRLGYFVLRSGDLWQCKSFTSFGPFVKIVNVGYKLDVARGDSKQPCLPVYIPFSLKGKP